jgi:hypothetical protein
VHEREQVAEPGLHRGRLAHDTDRDVDLDLVPQVDLVEVDVHRGVTALRDLDVLDQDLARPLAVDDEVDELRAPGPRQDTVELVRVQRQRHRVVALSVHDRRQLALRSEPAGRLAVRFPGGCVQLHRSCSRSR